MADIVNKVYKSNSVPLQKTVPRCNLTRHRVCDTSNFKTPEISVCKGFEEMETGSQASKLMTKKESSLKIGIDKHCMDHASEFH